jgi:chemotaxis protein methyltransferase CheR
VNRAIADLKDWHVTILATDINRRFLRKAEAGVYGAWSFRDPPQGLKESYFIAKSDGHYEIAQHIRRMVTFLPLNLAADVYPSLLNDTNAMDLIVCRNVLMYFTPEKTRSVVEKFRHCLVEGGWLTVSVNENAPEFFDTFETVMVGGSTFYRRPGATAGRPVETQRAGAEPAAVEKSERDPASVLAEARALYELGHYSDVPAVLSQEPVDPMAMELMARSFANAGKLDEALAWCDRTIAAAHLNPTGHFLRASILHEQGNLDEAAQAYQRALYLNPDFELAHFALGNLNSERGSHEAARRHFRHALRVLRAQKDDHILAESEGVTAGRLADIIASLLQMEAPHER